MKANELMIDDWVSYDGHNPDIPHGNVRVSCVARDIYELCVNDKKSTYDYIHPIPLTDEFFEANGFKYDKACLYWYKEIEKGLWLTICVWFHKLYKIEIIRGQYSYDGTHEKEVRVNTEPNVHLLQHALRLCGLEEIANNLKVE